MTVKYGKIELPQKISLEQESATNSFARYIAEPFERGYGHTIGNSLRRMLLTSIEAPAIISVRIDGVSHEYMPIDGVIEDMTNIILNFKGALLRKLPTEDSSNVRDSRILTCVLKVTQEDIDQNKGQYEVTLSDVVPDGFVEVVNPNLLLFTVTKPLQKQVDIRVGFGRGYVPSERHNVRDKTTDEILIDASFSPVQLVNYHVENTRVGQDTDYDKLILEITTDGRITPTEALSFASQIALQHYEVFERIESQKLTFFEDTVGDESDQDEIMDKLCLRIDEIELSVRSTNCLSGANIDTIAELVSIPERKMLEFRNFGKKSLNEIKAKLHEMGLGLGMDLSRYGITHENVTEKVNLYLEEKAKNETNKFDEV